jgi:tRNA1Val (adenine37-N6)-methyltransferase
MPNNYFQFKQFIVQQEHCAMKVTTDACLFGSIVAAIISTDQFQITNCLDIGAGTGLLSLMIAQKDRNVVIDAIEIDEQAANQAAANFQASPWKDRLHVHCTSIQQFNLSNNRLYDFIISNPPFFNNDLKSSDEKRNLALHSAELSLEELIMVIKNKLSKDGRFAVLMPHHRSEYFESLCKKEKMYVAEKISIKQTPAHHFFRTVFLCSYKNHSAKNSALLIKNEFNDYTTGFKNYLQDYYLN